MPRIFSCLADAWRAVGSLGGSSVLVSTVQPDLVLVETQLQIQVNLLSIARLVRSGSVICGAAWVT